MINIYKDTKTEKLFILEEHKDIWYVINELKFYRIYAIENRTLEEIETAYDARLMIKKIDMLSPEEQAFVNLFDYKKLRDELIEYTNEVESIFYSTNIDHDKFYNEYYKLKYNPERGNIKIETIKNAISDFFNMPFEEWQIKSRKSEYKTARQILHYFARKYTKLSLQAIGKITYPHRDHATVMHSVRTVNNLIDVGDVVGDYVKSIEAMINNKN